MRCPICGKETAYEDNPFRPFCSDRCKLIDLGEWVDGGYRIAGGNDGHKKPDQELPDDDA